MAIADKNAAGNETQRVEFTGREFDQEIGLIITEQGIMMGIREGSNSHFKVS
ncbi:MAG: hypothetical protein ACKPH6_22835 [Microcystis panniformis]